jgi:Phage Terminase
VSSPPFLTAGYPVRVCWKHRTGITCRMASGHIRGICSPSLAAARIPRRSLSKIAELHGRYQIRALAYDRWRIEDLKRELDAIGCGVPLVPFGQGFKDLSPAVDRLERVVEEGKLRHGNHPVLAMAAVNAKVELDAAGNRKISKRRSTGRVDPLVALCMGLGVAARPAPPIDVQAMIG